ncbi:Uncharacterized protein PBTT_06562 [Plasmodiophora brassicae]|uniref:Uncharacterized protein n=2 Tax=Plasmodiophora brassicae TaxID=37360 RepID=A0A3P3YAW1_PLABS|nr:unnamed protein product [Plasmodiophora brassicae]
METGSLDRMKDVVTKVLEKRGVLARLRAELRSEVFAAVDEHERGESAPRDVEPISSEALQIVVDFLRVHKLKHTLSVLSHEASVGQDALNRSVSDKSILEDMLASKRKASVEVKIPVVPGGVPTTTTSAPQLPDITKIDDMLERLNEKQSKTLAAQAALDHEPAKSVDDQYSDVDDLVVLDDNDELDSSLYAASDANLSISISTDVLFPKLPSLSDVHDPAAPIPSSNEDDVLERSFSDDPIVDDEALDAFDIVQDARRSSTFAF